MSSLNKVWLMALACGALILVAVSASLYVGDSSPESLSQVESKALNSTSGGLDSTTPDPSDVSVTIQDKDGDAMFRSMLDELFAVAKTDVSLAFERVSKITPSSFQSRFRTALAKRIVLADFSRLGEMIKLMTDTVERQDVLSETIREAIRKDPSNTSLVIRQQLTGDAFSHALRFMVQYQLESLKFDEAIATQLSMPFSHSRNTAIGMIANGIGERGIDATLAWINQLASEGEQPYARNSILQYFVRKKDYLALEKLLPYAVGDDRKMIIRNLAGQYSNDSRGLQIFLSSLPPDERDLVASTQILTDRSATFAQKMQMAGQLTNPEARGSTVSTVIANEASADPENAAKLVMALPEELRKESAGALVRAWLQNDSEAVSVWVQKLPHGPVREHAISTLAMGMRYTDRSAAREVATWIADSKIRERMLKMIGP